MNDFILALDQGTTSTRALCFDLNTLTPLSQASVPVVTRYPQEDWVEQDAEALWQGVTTCLGRALGAAPPGRLRCLGLTNQRETVVAWRRSTGLALAPALVWQDRRTAPWCAQLRNRLPVRESILQKTGLVTDPYFSASKIKWLLENSPEVQSAHKQKDLCVGTIDSFLLFRLSQGTCFCTDVTNASRTMLMDLRTLKYDKDLLDLFGIPEDILPQITPSMGTFCTCPDWQNAPVTGVLGDQQAALFGHSAAATGPGHAKITFGTGAFLLMNTGINHPCHDDGLLTTVAGTASVGAADWQSASLWGTRYAVEGSTFIAGAAIDFLKDQLGFFENIADIEPLMNATERAPHLLFAPGLAGLGAPYWNPRAKGVLWGLERSTTRPQIVRAVAESVVLQTAALLKLLEERAKLRVPLIWVDGGASANNTLMQFQADILQIPVHRPGLVEITAKGAAHAARRGFDPHLPDPKPDATQEFLPQMSPQESSYHLEIWQKSMKAVDSFYTESPL